MDGSTYTAVPRQAAARCVPPAPTEVPQQNEIKIPPRKAVSAMQPDNKLMGKHHATEQGRQSEAIQQSMQRPPWACPCA